MRKTIIAAALMATAGSAHAALPLVDIYAGAYAWNADTSGSFSSPVNDPIDMESDLGFDKERHNVVYLGLKHPIPFLPNVRLRQTNLSDSASNTLDQQIEFAGETYTANANVRSEYDLTMTDLTLSYNPLDTVVGIGFGLNIRRLESEFMIREQGGSSSDESGDKTFPQLHLSVGGKIPFTGFYGGAEINTIRFSGNRMEDFNMNVGWISEFFLGVELGYNEIRFELDDVGGIDADLKFSGPYLALSLNF